MKKLTTIIASALIATSVQAGSGRPELGAGQNMPNVTIGLSRMDYATIVENQKEVGKVYAWVVQEDWIKSMRYLAVHYDCTNQDNPVAIYDLWVDRMYIDKDYDGYIDKVIANPRDVKVNEYRPC